MAARHEPLLGGLAALNVEILVTIVDQVHAHLLLLPIVVRGGEEGHNQLVCHYDICSGFVLDVGLNRSCDRVAGLVSSMALSFDAAAIGVAGVNGIVVGQNDLLLVFFDDIGA